MAELCESGEEALRVGPRHALSGGGEGRVVDNHGRGVLEAFEVRLGLSRGGVVRSAHGRRVEAGEVPSRPVVWDAVIP